MTNVLHPTSPATPPRFSASRRAATSSSPATLSFLSRTPLRYAVLGAGFSGLSVAWHLLKGSPNEQELSVDIYDEVGLGGGASGVSGGLLHPYSPKGKLLWHGAECWKECMELLNVAETAAASSNPCLETGVFDKSFGRFIVRKRGILRPATNAKTFDLMNDNARNCLATCRVETVDKDSAQNLVPNLCLPLNLAFYMPGAMNVNPQRYLQALFRACQNSASASLGLKQFRLIKKSISEVLELEGEYDGVVICLGSKVDILPELTGKLPLRTCRGVIAHLQLPESTRGNYPENGPSILSDAWLAIQGPRSLHMGSTWEWKSRDYSSEVSSEEASKALDQLLPKATAVYPGIKNWEFAGARAGMRAMPPLTNNGSLPLLGCVDDLIGAGRSCKFWLFGGLGARGLLYHAWLGKLMAKAVLSCKEEVIPSELTSWKKTRVDILPELTGKLPLKDIQRCHSPLAVTREYKMHGSACEWQSRNYSSNISAEEVSKALDLLLSKTTAVYPGIMNGEFTEIRAGLKIMPPLSNHGALPLSNVSGADKF